MDRSALVEDLVLYIKTSVPELQLVKAYEGEFKFGGEKFLEEIRGLFPCALIYCERVEPDPDSDGDVKMIFGILVGERDFTGADNVPRIYSLSDKLIQAVQCYKPEIEDTIDWYEFLGDKHVAHNEFYALYEQRYVIMQKLCDCCNEKYNTL